VREGDKNSKRVLMERKAAVTRLLAPVQALWEALGQVQLIIQGQRVPFGKPLVHVN
jgi:hypothetical protein